MAFTVNPITGNITFGVVSDGTNDAVARDLASEFGVSEDFKDTFNADNWVDNGTQIAVNTGSGVIDWDADRQPGAQVTVFDLGAGIVSDVNWVLRFKLNINTYTEGVNDPEQILGVGLSDSDQTESGNDLQDFLGMTLHVSDTVSPTRLFTISYADGQAIPTSADPARFTDHSVDPSVGTFYVEIKRTSSASLEGNLYSDAKFTTLISNVSMVIPSTVGTLRFLKVMNFGDNFPLDHVLNGTIDNVQFWNVTTVPRITSQDWRIRFKLNLTNLDDGANTIDKRLWMSMSDSDETVGADSIQDSINLFIAFDQNTNRFLLRDTNGQAPDGVGNDGLFTAGLVTVSTKFVEIKRTSSTAYEASLFSDSTFTTLIESQSGTVSASTTGLRYIKFMNGGTLVNGAGAIDGTIDDFVYTDFEQLIVMPTKPFIVDAVLEGCTADFCEDFNEYAVTKLPAFREKFNFSTQALADASWVSSDTALIRVDPVNEKLDFDWTNHSVSDRIFHDLGFNTSETDWTLRCKATFSNVGEVTINAYCIGLYDSNAQDSGVAQDFVMIFMSDVVALRFGNNETLLLGQTSSALTLPTANIPVFWELKRIGGSTFRLTQYSDANYSVIIDSAELTGVPSTVDGLRFIKCLNRNDVAVGQVTGTFEDIEFWDEGQQGDVTFQDNFLQKAVTFSDDFTTYANQGEADTAWVPQDVSFMRVNITNDNLEWNSTIDNTNNSIALDLGVGGVNDEQWALRFKYTTASLDVGSNVGKYIWFGLFDSDGTVDSETTQDAIAFYIAVNSTINTINLAQRDGVILSNAGTDATLTTINTASDIFFVELKRTSATTAELTLYSDSTYTTVIESTTLTIPSTLTGLRFIAIKNRNIIATTGFMNGIIDDVQFYNGNSTLTDWSGATGNDVGLDIINKRINFDIPQGVQRDELLTFDLQTILDGSNASDDNWTLRFKINTDNIAQGTSEQSATLFVGLDDGLLPFNTTGHDIISFRVSIDQGGASPQFGAVPALREVENGQSLSGGSGINFPFMWTTGTLYVELKRLSPTLTECTLYTDATFRNVFSSVQLATTATLINLRYIRLSTDSSAVANDTTWDGFIDDIEFYNGVSVPRTPIEEIKDLEDNFFEDNFTNMAGSKVSVNTATQVIDWSSSVNAIYNEGEFIDVLGKVINTDRWALRCKLVINTATVNTDTTANDLYIGFSDDSTSVPNGFQDFIGWRYSLNNPSGAIRTLTAVAGQIDRSPEGAGTIYSTPVTTGTFYLETKRNGSNVTGTIYSDPDFTQVIESVTEPIEVAITGLRFLKVMVGNRDGSGNHTYDGTIDNIQFWDGQNSLDHENRWRKIDL